LSLELEILKASYWEHYKYEKDLSYILPLNDPKRIKILEEVNNISEQIRELENKQNNKNEIKNKNSKQ